MVPVKLISKEGQSQITVFQILRETTRFEWAFIIWQSRQESLPEIRRLQEMNIIQDLCDSVQQICQS